MENVIAVAQLYLQMKGMEILTPESISRPLTETHPSTRSLWVRQHYEQKKIQKRKRKKTKKESTLTEVAPSLLCCLDGGDALAGEITF